MIKGMGKAEGKSLEMPRPAVKETETEGELLVRLRRGESAAAHEFYDRYAQRLYRFILHTLGGRARGISPLPYIVLIGGFGSVGTLLYLIRRAGSEQARSMRVTARTHRP